MIVRLVCVLALIGAAIASAQPTKMPVVGILTPQPVNDSVRLFIRRLAELGYADGRTVRLEVRSAEAMLDRLPGLATDLVRAKPDVILAVNTPGTRAALAATKEIPIVMIAVGDPIGSGFVANLSRPGGNVTGITNLAGELAAKRLQVLHEAVPAARRIAALYNPNDPVTKVQIQSLRHAAPTMGLELRFFVVRDDAGLVQADKDLAAWRAEAGFWVAGQHQSFVKRSVELALKRRLPLMSVNHWEVEAGGLIAYYPDLSEQYRRAAEYVDRILKGGRATCPSSSRRRSSSSSISERRKRSVSRFRRRCCCAPIA